MSEHLDVAVDDRERVRTITLDRPASRNGLTVATTAALSDAIDGAGAAGARAIVLRGAGGSFCSGLDLKEAGARGFADLARFERDMRGSFHGLIRAIRAAPQPVIASVDGAAVGFGCDVALACDLRIASDRARFGEIFVSRGLVSDGGGSFHLPRLVGLGRALELLFTGDLIDAATAERIGLCNRVVSAADLDREVAALAARIAAGPPRALELIKRAVYAGLEGDLPAALDREAVGQLECIASADFAEGLAAFLAKRPPRFTGR